MHDLTEGSIRKHLFGMATPIAAGMLMQTLYYLVDLYFVGRLGDAALAGSSANPRTSLTFVVPAVWLTSWPGLEIEHVRYLSVTSVGVAGGHEPAAGAQCHAGAAGLAAPA